MSRLFAALLVLGACSFDSSGPAGGLPDPSDGGSGPDAGDPADAAPCPEPLHLELSVNGETAPPATGAPFARVLVGDTVELSARGSCVQNAPISYQWQISPIDGTRDSAAPGLDAETVEVFSTVADRSYNVSLTITDVTGNSEERTVFAFVAHGFAQLGDGPGNGDVRDLSFGGGKLWIAAKDGAFAHDPATPAGTFVDLAAEWLFTGPAFTNELQAVWFDDASGFVWFGRKNSEPGVWRGNPLLEQFSLVSFSQPTALGGSAEVHDIDDAGDGVRVATSLGVTTAPDDLAFVGRIAPPPVEVVALARAGGVDWAGGVALWNLAAAGNSIDMFDNGADNDDKIVGMAADVAAGLWLASDGLGVARANAATGAPMVVYTTDQGLSSDEARGLVVELDGPAEGDVWVATKSGLSRFKADRGVWVRLGSTAGLGQRTDLRAIAIDRATRTVYAGSNRGLVYIRVP